jgi:hypothetical protein
VGTSTLSMAVGAGVETLPPVTGRLVETGRRVGVAVCALVGAGVEDALGVVLGWGPPEGCGHVPKSGSNGLLQSARAAGIQARTNVPRTTKMTAPSRPRRVIRVVAYGLGEYQATAGRGPLRLEGVGTVRTTGGQRRYLRWQASARYPSPDFGDL